MGGGRLLSPSPLSLRPCKHTTNKQKKWLLICSFLKSMINDTFPKYTHRLFLESEKPISKFWSIFGLVLVYIKTSNRQSILPFQRAETEFGRRCSVLIYVKRRLKYIIYQKEWITCGGGGAPLNPFPIPYRAVSNWDIKFGGLTIGRVIHCDAHDINTGLLNP